jgi:acyl-CoA dehydrogenase
MYSAPVDEIIFTLNEVAGLRHAVEAGRFGDLSADLVTAVLSEAGRFASEEMAPLSAAGDRHGVTLKDGAVTTPPGWKDLYRRWSEGGWNALTGPVDFGGQGLPMMLSVAALEMWNSAAMAFALGPTLTMGAVEALHRHATDELKRLYLAKLVSGEWMGTMNLTEPQAGSDLGVLSTRAERAPDGTYRILGQKIFITYGEHDFTENIVHMVLARLPDAPAGTRGISMFLVPKFLVNADGSLGRRNDLHCASLEHKLGIHGSPTCTMIYGDGLIAGEEAGAVGWLIGEENRGLACMFTMMNNARLAIGLEGIGIAEAAFQKALAFANERRQGKASGWKGEGMAPIVHHPDVQRMLLTMQALTRAARSIAYACAHALDMASTSEGEENIYWQERANLLTPIAKAFSTDIGSEVASLGIQVHGGMGYIEETGAAAFYRDARIASIYEGTNGIQAIDLVTRKLGQSDGEHVRGYVLELADTVDVLKESGLEGLGEAASYLEDAVDDLAVTTDHLQAAVSGGLADIALAGATPYLRLFALASGGVHLARAALLDPSPQRIALFRFFAENLAPETEALRSSITVGAEGLLAAGKSLIVD